MPPVLLLGETEMNSSYSLSHCAIHDFMDLAIFGTLEFYSTEISVEQTSSSQSFKQKILINNEANPFSRSSFSGFGQFYG